MIRQAVFVLLLLPNFLWGQSVIKGTITDSKGEAVSYVNIGIVGTQKGCVSGEDGRFELKSASFSPTDSLYFSHLNYQRKAISVKDIKAEASIVLTERAIDLPEIKVTAKKRTLKTLRGRGVRFAGAVFSILPNDASEESTAKEEVGDFITLKKDWVATDFRMKCIRNTLEKLVFRLSFYKMEGEKMLPLTLEPIYIEVPKVTEKTDITAQFQVPLPKGKIWIGLQTVDVQGTGKQEAVFPISFSGGYTLIDEEFEKIPLGIGISFSVKGYEYQ